MHHSTHGLLDDLLKQREAIGVRSPVYGRLLGTLAELYEHIRDPLAQAWSGRWFNTYYDRPLLLLAALRADALRTGTDHPLWQAIVSERPQLGAVTVDAVAGTLDTRNRQIWRNLRTRFVQTNETSRALVWQWPLRLLQHPGPLVLVDLGASAGLNLVADRLECPWYLPGGEPLISAPQTVKTQLRLGLDARPLDAFDTEDARWLQACVWPGETRRIERLRAALDAFRRVEDADRPVLEICGAPHWADRLQALRRRYPGLLILAYQTMVRDYLSGADRRAWGDSRRRWLSSEPPGKALLVRLEMVDPEAGPDCAVDAEVAAGGSVAELELARTGFHPRVVRPNRDSVRDLTNLFA